MLSKILLRWKFYRARVCYRHKIPKIPEYVNSSPTGFGFLDFGICELCVEEARERRNRRTRRFVDKQDALIGGDE